MAREDNIERVAAADVTDDEGDLHHQHLRDGAIGKGVPIEPATLPEQQQGHDDQD